MTRVQPPQVEQILATGSWFSGLPREIACEVRNAGRLRALAAGASLFEQGGAPSGLHAMITGQLRIIAMTHDGDLQIAGIARPGDWVGFLACLDHGPHVYSGIAQQDMQVFSLSPTVVSAIFERDVATFRHLLAPELNLARKVYGYVIEDAGEPHRRIAARITGLGRWPYAYAGGPLAPLEELKQAELAASVKLSRQTVNATLRNFEARGLIELGYGRIRVLDPHALERIASYGRSQEVA